MDDDERLLFRLHLKERMIQRMGQQRYYGREEWQEWIRWMKGWGSAHGSKVVGWSGSQGPSVI